MVCLNMRTYELRFISNRIGFMYDWHLKSCVGSYVCAIIIFVINSLNEYLSLNTDCNLSLSDPTLYPELLRRPIFESPSLLYLTLSGYPYLKTRCNACLTSDSLGEHIPNTALCVFRLDALRLLQNALHIFPLDALRLL